MHQMLTQLKLARIREIHQEWFDRAAETQMPYPDFLRGLLQEELLAREDNQLRDVTPISNFFTAAKKGTLPAVSSAGTRFSSGCERKNRSH